MASRAQARATGNVVQDEEENQSNVEPEEDHPLENQAKTTFNQKIRMADIKTFKGMLVDLDVFNNAIKQCLVV